MSRRFLIAVLSTVLVGFLCLIGAAEEPDAPKTELERFNAAIETISANVTNAGAKLKNGAITMGSGSPDKPSTPAHICCGSNIVVIEKEIEKLAKGIQSLRACYSSNDQAQAGADLSLVFQDSSSLYRALGNFSKAERHQLLMGYGAVVKSVILLKKSTAKLEECGTSEVP